MDKALKREIDKISKKIRDSYHPKKIILFGSAVRGELNPGSDIDFFIIKDSMKPSHKRIVDIFRILRNLKRNYPLDFIVFTPKEIKERLKIGDYFIKNIYEEGKIIYESK